MLIKLISYVSSLFRKRVVAEPTTAQQEIVPRNLDEAVEYLLEKHADDRELQDLFERGEKDFSCALHFGLGQHIRNEWGLWTKDAPLAKWFREHGIRHADDMSGIILKSLYRKMSGQDICLKEQILSYRAHWYKVGIDPDHI